MRVLVCGSRNWAKVAPIRRELQRIKDLECVIEGEAKGADRLSRWVATDLGVPVERFPADWLQYGRAAGPIRNRKMLRDGKPDLVLAFHENLAESKGTKDMVEQAKRAGVPVKVFSR